MAGSMFMILACSLVIYLASTFASSAIVERTFTVRNLAVTRLCSQQVVAAVNGKLPGPTLNVHEGDTLIVHVFNKSPYNLTIHWHGIFQRMSAWADGPSMVTQCPIRPGNKYTYKFKIIDQVGTLWWHAHSSWLRATVYGALIIRPKPAYSYKPPSYPFHFDEEALIILGEWWNANPVDVEKQWIATGDPTNVSDAYTINGLPGDLYKCSNEQIYTLHVKKRKTYLLRLINAALETQLFFKIANHNMTVVALDASYTTPYDTDVVVAAPGQTVDALLTADQPVGTYYMAAKPYASSPKAPLDNTTSRGMIIYNGAVSSTAPVFPAMPDSNDTPTAHKFYTNITGLKNGPNWAPVPIEVDKQMFVTIGLGYEVCPKNISCLTFNGKRHSASMNNASFVFPAAGPSMLQAFFHGVNGVYTTDFPDRPPLELDYTNDIIHNITAFLFAPKSTKVTKLKFNSTVELVFQNVAFIGVENHPIHIHGFNFHVLAQGFGNYNASRDSEMFNLVNPQIRNTVAVPVGGWAVIRFRADNPGVWLAHCHIETHMPMGLTTAFEVENDPTSSMTLPPPPADLPRC